MSKNLKPLTKMLLVPTLIVGALSACGYANDGARTNNIDGMNTRNYDATPYMFNADDGPYNRRDFRGYNNFRMRDGMSAGNPGAVGFNRNATGGAVNGREDQRIAQNAAIVAKSVGNVDRATAVVNGNDIVIGIDVKQGANERKVEENVRQKVKQGYPGYNVHVTADRNIHKRIGTLSRDWLNNNGNNNMTPGQPVRDLGNDIADVIRDIGRTVTAPLR